MTQIIQLLILSFVVSVSGLAAASTKKTKMTKAEVVPVETSKWSTGFSYGVTTDLAEPMLPRIYYQGVGINTSYMINERWSILGGLNFNFTTLDGQIDKKQEESALESTGVNPSLGLNYTPSSISPWFLSANANANALLDTASRREGYLGLLSFNGGGTWTFFERLSMTHALGFSELLNTYDTSSGGSPNPGSAINYSFSNSLKASEMFSLGAMFGLKRTRYLDGYWDYSYTTALSANLVGKSWSASFSTSNGGYTEDGRVSLWYIDKYRRLVSISMSYQF